MRARKCIFLLFLLCFGCLEPYSPPVNATDTNSIVIDGYIDAGGSAIVKLSRSLPLYSFANFPAETKAVVTIESSDNEVFALKEETDGVYSASGLTVDQKTRYKLHVKTSNQREYISDDVQIHPTPTIARVYFDKSASGDEIEVKTDTRDVNTDATGFYAWESVETYEYRSAYFSRFKRVNGLPHLRVKGEYIDTCWRDERVPIVLTTTKNLESNLIFGKVIARIPKLSPKISIRYSILVRMRSISEQEFDYRNQLAKYQDGQDDIFAEIPGAIATNVRSTTDEHEIVLGFFRGQQVKERRMFIEFLDLPQDFKDEQPLPFGCDLETTCPVNAPVTGPNQCIDVALLSDSKVIISAFEFQNFVVYTFTPQECGDCRAKGGTTVQPYYW